MLIDLLRALGRGLRHGVTGLLALLILFEEWGWEPLQRQVARLARLAMWLIGRGQWLLGSLVVVAAKLLGTALAARLFTLTRPALLLMPWFARLYRR